MKSFRLITSCLAISAVLSATSYPQSHDLLRTLPFVGPVAPEVQDTSWWPHGELPPFVSEFVEEADDHEDLIHAGSGLLTIEGEPELPAALHKELFVGGRFQPGWFLVHFERPVTVDDKLFLDATTGPVRRADGSALARWYVPNNTLAAWIDSADVYTALEEAGPIDLVARYQPAYKVDPRIGAAVLNEPARAARATYVLNLDVMPGHSIQAVARDAQALGAVVHDQIELRGASVYDVRFAVVEVEPALVTAMALIEGVRTVQEAGAGLAKHDLSGGGKLQNRNLAADDVTGTPIVTSANFPLWLTHDLQGQGQVIGVVDTSMDWNNNGVSGCAFGYPDTNIDNYGFALPVLSSVLIGSVGSGGVNLKIPRADLLGGATLQGVDANEHGVAASGAALGDFYGNNDNKWWEHDPDQWDSWAPTNYSGLLGPGIAHEAQLYFTPVMDSSNGFRWESFGEFETHMGTTLSNMAAAGVSTTNHSVGLAEASNTYTQVSVVHDTKAYDHPDMLQCMAAGNSGAGSNKLTSQAVVKNAMGVGASDDVLQPENRASFSSTGPRFDGARKPDIMAPGTDEAPRAGGVQSLLILPNTNGTSSASCAYQYTSGTSFASPTLAGAGALVHQYFQEGRYTGGTPVTDPSAALLKAMLVNAGHRLTGANLDGVYPGNYQGWGEPNLMEVLDFGTSNRDLIVKDVPSNQGFTGSGSANDVTTFTVDGSGEQLKVALAWTDEPGSAGTGKKLINDLHLIVTAPGGATYRGNVFNTSAGTSITGGSADTLNNVEGVILNSPATGAWTATVDPSSGNYASGQGFALVITGDVTEGGGGGPSAPVSDFTGSPTSGDAPLLVNFTSLATGTIDTWAWTFGDGGTSNAVNPSHTYTTAGSYNVSLTVTGPGGTDGETKNGYITVSDPPPPGGGKWYMSFTSGVSIPGVGNIADEDVVSYDPATGTWERIFDGSDVGVTQDVNALHVLENGDLVLSFQAAVSVPGLTGGPSGTSVDDSDLVIFSFTQQGNNTQGAFSFVFDGSDVGMTSNGEDIDGVYEFPGGGLGISTVGSASVTGLSGIRDEDVIFFNATQYGSATVGSFSAYFDGSDVGFSTSSSEDLNAVAFDDGVDLLFSTIGTYSASGGSGQDEDISRFSGTFGASTSGSASLELDLSALGISANEDVDGLCFR
jgi:PKD repeat protein